LEAQAEHHDQVFHTDVGGGTTGRTTCLAATLRMPSTQDEVSWHTETSNALQYIQLYRHGTHELADQTAIRLGGTAAEIPSAGYVHTQTTCVDNIQVCKQTIGTWSAVVAGRPRLLPGYLHR